MINIILCEDNINQRKQIEKIIDETTKELNIDSYIELSTDSSTEVINYLANNRSKSYIYFFDVELNDNLNGIELANKIRKYDSKGYVVFITSHSELSLLTFKYKVEALDYIIKSDERSLKQSIEECIKAATLDYNNSTKDKDTITINLGNRINKININEILFVQTTEANNKLRIHTEQGQFEFYGIMKEMENNLSSDFCWVNKISLVNINKVKTIDKKKMIIHMKNDETCFISNRYLKGLIRKCCTN